VLRPGDLARPWQGQEEEEEEQERLAGGGGGGRRGEERRGAEGPCSAAAVELLGARLLCALYALLAWERDPPAGALGWGWAMHYGRRATY
jgi:hypothetical protein